jgi:matrixin
VVSFPRCLGLIGAVALATSIAAPVAVRSSASLVVDTLRGGSAATAPTAIAAALPACSDATFTKEGAKQPGTYKWSFKASSTPSYLTRTGVASALQQAFTNVTTAHNDCGRADNVGATHEYLGTTSRAPNCRNRDGFNVIGFGKLGSGVLAATCYWMSNGKIVEADVTIATSQRWALSLAGCHDKTLLQSTMTHEAGHVFGLGHVGESKHGRLTMSPYIDGLCEDNETTLGLGDMLGLESLY